MSSEKQDDLRRATEAVDRLRESHPWIDLQGLDDDDCEVVARAVLSAIFTDEEWQLVAPDDRDHREPSSSPTEGGESS